MTYTAGLNSFHTRDADGTIPCALWYPTHEPEHSKRQGVYDFSIAPKAPLADGLFPLLVISHGSGGTRYGHCKTAEALARAGYMVLSFDHPQNNFFDDSAVGTAASYSHRSRHVQSALNGLLAHPLGCAVDQNRIAIMGFSLGGFTALCCVGGQPTVAGLRQHLRHNRDYDQTFCRLEVIVKQGYDADLLPVTHDPRFKACIALAPVSGGLFTGAALNGISVPVMIYRALQDAILQHPFHAAEIKANLPQGCIYHETPNADHFGYLSPVRPDARAALGDMAHDPVGFDRTAVHQALNQEILTFLAESLS